MKHHIDRATILASGDGWFVAHDTLYHRSDLDWEPLARAQSAVNVSERQPVDPASFEAFLKAGTAEPELASEPVADETAPKGTNSWLTTTEASERLGIHRSTLDEMYDMAPKNLPGSPINVAMGKERRHLRWDPQRLSDWIAAYNEWKVQRSRRSRS